MPPRDPRQCPDLDRALPADDIPGTTHVLDWPERRLVLFGSGEWHPVHVRAWRTDRHGRTVIDCEWYAAGGTWTESYVVEAGKIRSPD